MDNIISKMIDRVEDARSMGYVPCWFWLSFQDAEDIASYINSYQPNFPSWKDPHKPVKAETIRAEGGTVAGYSVLYDDSVTELTLIVRSTHYPFPMFGTFKDSQFNLIGFIMDGEFKRL